VSCVTFGSPRVGNKDFAAEFDRAVGTQFRVVHKTDPMTKVPTETRYVVAGCSSDGLADVLCWLMLLTLR
jgi:hypothetical protein